MSFDTEIIGGGLEFLEDYFWRRPCLGPDAKGGRLRST